MSIRKGLKKELLVEAVHPLAQLAHCKQRVLLVSFFKLAFSGCPHIGG